MRWLWMVLIVAGCTYDPASERWPELYVRDVDPLLGLEAPTGLIEDQEVAVALWGAHPDIRVIEDDPDVLELKIKQPIDWRRVDRGWFWQRVLVRLALRPTYKHVVLQARGYHVPTQVNEGELELLLDATRIDVEHRYFGSSWPDVDDTKSLTAAQSAADLHRVVALLQPSLQGTWVSSGVSKGGMGAIYHRYFFPEDVTATVAYVAPALEGEVDARVVGWFDRFRLDDCKANIQAYQRTYLDHLDAVADDAFDRGVVDDPQVAKDLLIQALANSEWSAFQYRSLNPDCEFVGVSSEAHAVAVMRRFYDLLTQDSFDTITLSERFAYYHQSRHELGFPDTASTWLRKENPDFVPVPVVPKWHGTFPRPRFDPNLQAHIRHWLEHEAERVLLVYGQFDPWNFAAIEPSEDGVHVFTVPEGDHMANIDQLPPGLQEQALGLLTSWVGEVTTDMRLPPPPHTEGLSLLFPAFPERWVEEQDARIAP